MSTASERPINHIRNHHRMVLSPCSPSFRAQCQSEILAQTNLNSQKHLPMRCRYLHLVCLKVGHPKNQWFSASFSQSSLLRGHFGATCLTHPCDRLAIRASCFSPEITMSPLPTSKSRRCVLANFKRKGIG